MRVDIDADQLKAILAERDELREQRDALQARMSEMVESTLARRVRKFTSAIGHSVRHTPEVPPDDEVRLRLKLIAEEFFELLEASINTNATGWIDTARATVDDAIKSVPLRVDLVEVADALADIAYVVEGMNACLGIPSAAIATEVHRSNMTKIEGGSRRADGKWQKPDGWQPPDIAHVLRDAGWRS